MQFSLKYMILHKLSNHGRVSWHQNWTIYPCFEIGEYPNPVQVGKTRQNGFGSGW